MGVLEALQRIVELGGASEHAARVFELRTRFEERTGAFAPEDPWFEERSRAFWCDAVTRGAFGREVHAQLNEADRSWLGPLGRAHRGLFRADPGTDALVDVWSGAELLATSLDDGSRAEQSAGAGQLFDARVVAAEQPYVVALLPGAIFHARDATPAILSVVAAARARAMPTDEALDALLRMERTLRSLSRVKAAYAYRADALSPRAPSVPVRRSARGPT
jgi:hypothetical protein